MSISGFSGWKFTLLGGSINSDAQWISMGNKGILVCCLAEFKGGTHLSTRKGKKGAPLGNWVNQPTGLLWGGVHFWF